MRNHESFSFVAPPTHFSIHTVVNEVQDMIGPALVHSMFRLAAFSHSPPFPALAEWSFKGETLSCKGSLVTFDNLNGHSCAADYPQIVIQPNGETPAVDVLTCLYSRVSFTWIHVKHRLKLPSEALFPSDPRSFLVQPCCHLLLLLPLLQNLQASLESAGISSSTLAGCKLQDTTPLWKPACGGNLTTVSSFTQLANNSFPGALITRWSTPAGIELDFLFFFFSFSCRAEWSRSSYVRGVAVRL